MRLRPFPVVMVSSLTARGRRRQFARWSSARSTASASRRSIIPIRSTTCPRASAPPPAPGCSARPAASERGRRIVTYKPDGRIVAIGASTGGVEALISVIAGYPENCPPTIVTVHMPSPFTRSFARRLDGLTGAHVEEAEEGADRGRPGLSGAGHAHASRSDERRPSALSPQQRRTSQRPPPFGRRDVRIDGQGFRLALGRRHSDRNGPRRRRRPAVDPRRRKHARPERGLERRLRHAQGRVRNRRCGASAGAWRHARRHPQADV